MLGTVLTADSDSRSPFLSNLIVAGAYTVAGYFCLIYSHHNGYANPFWIPAGIALAGALLSGPKVLPGIALAATLTLPEIAGRLDPAPSLAPSILANLPIGIAVALQAGLGALLIRRVIGWPNPLTEGLDIIRFLTLGGPLSCLIVATVAIPIHHFRGLIPGSQAGYEWFTWYVGDTVGVIIVTPILLTLFARPREAWRPRIWALGAPLAISFVLSAIAYRQTRAYEAEILKSRFNEAAQALVKRFDNDFEILDRLPAVVDSHDLNPAEGPAFEATFRQVARSLFSMHPRIQTVSWEDVVPDSERAAYERRQARILGNPAFRIWEFDPNHRRVPPPHRDTHVVIRLTEPVEPGRQYTGLDVSSYLQAHGAGPRDFGSRRPTVVPSVTLFNGDRSGMLVYYPVFARDGRLSAFVTVVIALERAIEAAAGPLLDRGSDLAVKITSDSPERQTVFERGIPAGSRDDRTFRYATVIELKNIRNARWSIEVVATREYLRQEHSFQAWLVLAAMLLICCLLGGFLLVLAGTSEIQRRLAGQLRVELREKEKANENIRRLEADLERSWRLVTAGELATGLAHELSQPLASVRNYAQGALRMLERAEPRDPDIRESLEEISKEAERAGKFIQSLRAFLTRKDPVRKRELLNSIVTEIMAIFDRELIAHQVRFTVELTPQNTTVLADRVQVGQVFLNLLRNAIESMSGNEPGDRRLLVKTTVEDGDCVQVSFVDNGCGIPEGIRTLVFEPFYTTKPTGMGMGLAISKTVIEAHSGRLGAISNPDRGTTFYVQLPRLQENPK